MSADAGDERAAEDIVTAQDDRRPVIGARESKVLDGLVGRVGDPVVGDTETRVELALGAQVVAPRRGREDFHHQVGRAAQHVRHALPAAGAQEEGVGLGDVVLPLVEDDRGRREVVGAAAGLTGAREEFYEAAEGTLVLVGVWGRAHVQLTVDQLVAIPVVGRLQQILEGEEQLGHRATPFATAGAAAPASSIVYRTPRPDHRAG
ncbi:MAG TPA: hypothetical protein VFW96_19555 [Thermomicrobiales bacterium]|nr:hypothetical protein [Thermomicrobiales bacterium]